MNKRWVRRRGTAAVLVAVLITGLIGVTALAVDLGYLYVARGELQRAADAAALAGAGALFTESNVDPAAARGTAAAFAALNRAAGDNVLLSPSDAEVGRIEYPLLPSYPFVPVNDASANSVRVAAARRMSEDRGIDLFFAPIFGVDTVSLGATAVASRVLVSSAPIIPIALRTPDFGPVNPEIAEHNPGKDGPSYPANGESFQIGEEVVVFLFGNGVRPPIHLTLDLPGFEGVADTNKMLSGQMPPALVNVGDEMPIWNQGAGDGNFGVKLVDRMEDGDPDNDTVVLPIVATLPDSRNEDGELVGDIQIVDFVGTRLLRVETVDIYNPDKPGQGQGHNFTVQRVVGVVVNVVISQGEGTNQTNGYGSDSVVMLQLVR